MQIEFTEKIKSDYDYTILGVYEDKTLSQTTKKYDKELKGIITKSIENSKFKGIIGDKLIIHSEKIILIGMGKLKDLNNLEYEKIGGIIGKILVEEEAENSLLLLDILDDEKKYEIALGAVLKTYRFDKYKNEKSNKKENKLYIHTENPMKSKNDYENTKAIIDGIITTRNLANEPSNFLTTTQFIKESEKLSKLGIKIEIIEEKQLKKMGANLILAVNQGSNNPAYILTLKYTGNKKSKNTIALIGKGLCFDSGGISIKPSKNMDEMKSDMTGGATVLGIMEMVAKQKLNKNIIGIIGLAENMPDGHSYKPGDIIKSLSGKTVEVLNTDAEGRLVLADCLTYAQKEYKPEIIIDMATLTGGVVVALGEEYAGLFSNDEKLSKDLIESGKRSGDKVWELPLSKEYNEMIKSEIADMKNLGQPESYAQSITAAEFLHNFIENETKWAHIDIAGTAWCNKEKSISPIGLTGFGVKLINEYLKKI